MIGATLLIIVVTPLMIMMTLMFGDGDHDSCDAAHKCGDLAHDSGDVAHDSGDTFW